MSSGAVFKLIANDGKVDRLIMATKLLNQRIKDVMCARKRAGKADITPTLVDLERTHVLYMNAHFKPFAAIGYEYNKVRPQSGNATLGSGVTFSIPQFGDFFHDMVLHIRLSSCQALAGTTPLQSDDVGALFPLNTADHLYNIVDPCGNIVVAGVAQAPDTTVAYKNLVRFCEFPGIRIVRKTAFQVNGNPLDEYDDFVPVMLAKFCTPPNKIVGHNRLLGQEVPLEGYSGLCCAPVTDANAAQTPAGIGRNNAGQSNLTIQVFEPAAAGAAASSIASVDATVANLNAADPQLDVSRELKQIVNGPQTPKPVQPALELWHKLRFWFNDDVRLAIPSVSIPFGQRFITLELAQADALVFEYPSIYLETTILTGGGGAATGRATTYSPIFIANGITAPTIEALELYVNNIFVNPEVHDIYIKRIGFSLIRVYRQQQMQCNSAHDEKLLSQLKWPIEYMFVGFRPRWNTLAVTTTAGVVTGGNQNLWRDWHRMTRLVDATCDCPCNEVAVTASVAVVVNVATVATGSRAPVIPEQYWIPVSTVDSVSLVSHGIPIYDRFPDTFFNAYAPFHYGGSALVTPDDTGALFVNMALFPRSYQPSGHLNISRARETYLNYTSSYIGANTPATMVVVAIAINFLLITDGSAVLRYST